MSRPALAVAMALSLSCARGPGDAPVSPPDGRAEIEASRQAMLKVSRFTIEVASTTRLQAAHTTYRVDCAQRYYYNRHVVDLTPEGVERGSTQLQGRPRAHQESEQLHVDGRSYERYSGHWEGPSDPGLDREQLEWAPTRSYISFAEKADCGRIRQEPDLLGVPYSKMANATAVEFVGRQVADGVPCHEFRVSYVDTVYGERMIERQSGPNSSASSREMVQQPLEASICVGLADKLAYRVRQVDITRLPLTRQLTYGEFDRLPAPAITQ